MNTEPHLTIEGRLLAHPFHTLFFTTIALNTYAFLAFVLMMLISPDTADRLVEPGVGEIDLLWRLQLLVQVAVFAHASLWAERIGVGPFAGRLNTTFRWIVVAVVASPIINILIQRLVFAMLLNGDTEGAFTSELARLMTSYEALAPMMLFAIVVAAPLAEEVIYRGIGIGYLSARGVPGSLAILLTAIIFTMIHSQYSFPAMATVFLLGLFLGWLRVKSGSITPSIVAHIVINLQAVLTLAEAGAAATSNGS